MPRGKGFGSVYDKARDGQAPNIWITWYEGGRKRYRAVGRVDDRGKTRGEVRAAERRLRQLAAKQLADIALRIDEGRAGVERTDQAPLFRHVALDWAEDRRDATKRHADFGQVKVVRNGGHDYQRVMKYLVPFFGDMRLDEIDTPQIWDFVKARRREGLSGATVERLLAILSRLYNSLAQTKGLKVANPVTRLDPKKRKQLARSEHDPKTTPFLHRKEHIRAVYQEIREPHLRALFAVGVFAGLRTNEQIALEWGDVDLERRVITVQRQKVNGKKLTGPLKNDASRKVPINDSLLPILRQWKVASGGGKGLVCPSPRSGGLLYDDTPHNALQRALDRLEEAGVEVPRVSWYQATRHTMASHYVMDGGSIEKLSAVLGHSSIIVTERYAHLRPELFTDADRALGCVDLVTEPCRISYDLVTLGQHAEGSEAANS